MLINLALIMCVAAVTTVVFHKLRQPVVLGYLLAGVIVGRHLPVPLFADEALARQMSELGVVLLMFSLGLDFSLRRLVRLLPTAGLIAAIECSLMISLGYLTGRLFGWSRLESLFAGALISISSTTIIVKAFAEQKVKGNIADVVFGILVAEDLIAILLLAVLTPVASGAGLSPGALALTIARLAAFLLGILGVGLLTVPRLMRVIVKMGRTETTVVASVGLSFGLALLAHELGYSVALGAFLAGALVAESGEAKTIAHAIEPVRDLFAAVFFVSVGMLIDPAIVASHWVTIVVLALLVMGGKLVGVGLGAFLAGNGVRTSVQAGMSLGQIGEFSFIIAGAGLALGAVNRFLYPIAVAVSALTTMATPWMIRASGPVASFIDRRLPHPLQTFATLYGSWVERIRATPQRRSAWAAIRRLIKLLLIDLVGIAAVVIGAALTMSRLEAVAHRYFELAPPVAHALVIAAAAALVTPFLLGAVRLSRALGIRLAAEALPTDEGRLDLAAAPRRALVVTLQVAILLVAGIPLVALTQPFVSSVPGVIVLLAGLSILVVPFWRSATNLHSHVKAGAQVLLEALASQGLGPASESASLVPGLGEPETVPIDALATCVGKTLKALNLRALTGATVIAIDRGAGDVVYPNADDTIEAGDVLVLTGTKDAVAAARELLEARRAA
jgi:CPA2 family monovalent cation:H+ antiporter-2